MKPTSRSGKTTIFRNQFVHLYSARAEFPNGTKEYFVTEKGVRVGCLLLRDDHVLLVRQYRFLIDDYSWEIPGGGVDEGESSQQAIKRECVEEAGIVCNSLQPLFDYMLGTDVSDNQVSLYSCEDFSLESESGDGMETDAHAWVAFEHCLTRVFSGEIQDLMTITALLTYDRTRRQPA